MLIAADQVGKTSGYLFGGYFGCSNPGNNTDQNNQSSRRSYHPMTFVPYRANAKPGGRPFSRRWPANLPVAVKPDIRKSRLGYPEVYAADVVDPTGL
jgi:hypothetical protein